MEERVELHLLGYQLSLTEERQKDFLADYCELRLSYEDTVYPTLTASHCVVGRSLVTELRFIIVAPGLGIDQVPASTTISILRNNTDGQTVRACRRAFRMLVRLSDRSPGRQYRDKAVFRTQDLEVDSWSLPKWLVLSSCRARHAEAKRASCSRAACSCAL